MTSRIPIILAFFAFIAAAATLNGPGPVWDEPFTLHASEVYVDWLFHPDLSKASIDGAWSVNHEHPPLAKVWPGLVRHAVQAAYPGTHDVFASRLASAILFGVLVGMVAAFAARAGAAAGLAAGLFAFFMPRLFSDAHFATLDLPVAAAWFATAFAFAKGIHSRRWAVAAGVLFGAALLTKINAVIIPLPLVAWAIIFHRRKAIVPSLLLLAIGPALLIAGWPWLWHSTLPRLGAYLFGTTLDRFIVPVYYLGTVYAARYAPWHYPFVLTLFTIPAGVLLCLGVGLWRSMLAAATSLQAEGFTKNTASRRSTLSTSSTPSILPAEGHEYLVLAALNLAAILGVSALPFAPKYDGVRLFMPLFPFAACVAGAGFQRLWDRLPATRLRTAAAGVFIALQSTGLVLYHPYETSYYNLLCGGLPGAARLGLETTYWCDAYSDPVFDLVNSLPAGTRVALYPVGEAMDAFYRVEGYVQDKIRIVDFRKEEYDYAVLMNREGMLLQDEKARRLFHENPERRILTVKRLGTTLSVIKRRD